jgi:hypothetical protein
MWKEYDLSAALSSEERSRALSEICLLSLFYKPSIQMLTLRCRVSRISKGELWNDWLFGLSNANERAIMKSVKTIGIALVLLGAAAMSGTASAHGHFHHHHGAHVGVFIGAPIVPWYYPPAYYYYTYPSVVVTEPAQPPVYIEQQTAPLSSSALEPGYWYYCHSPEGYYPYIKQCPGGWQKVPPSSTSR